MQSSLVFVLCIIFIVVVIPYWLKLHYGDRKSKSGAKDSASKVNLAPLNQLADDLQKRVQVLESILDSESPEWRKKYE